MNNLVEGIMKLAENPAIQKKFQVGLKEQRKMKGRSSGGGVDQSIANSIVEDIKAKIASEVFVHIPSTYKYSDRSPNGLFEVVYKGVNSDGEYEYELNFKYETVHRESLWEEGYPEGLENIVAFRSHGGGPSKGPIWNNVRSWLIKYDASVMRKGEHRKQGLYKEGSHIFIKGGTTYRPDPFLSSYISELNSVYSKQNVKIILNRKYYP